MKFFWYKYNIMPPLLSLSLLSLCLHHFIVPDNLDGHLLVSLERVPGSHHVAEHSLARVAVNCVAAIQLLTNANTWEGRGGWT